MKTNRKKNFEINVFIGFEEDFILGKAQMSQTN